MSLGFLNRFKKSSSVKPSSGELLNQKEYVEQLFAQYSASLHSYLQRYCSNPSDIDEILQEAYIRILNTPDHSRPSNPRAYLYKIALNLVRDQARRAKVRQQDAHINSDDCELHSSEDTPEQAVLWDQGVKRISAAIETLSPRCQSIFVMSRFQDMSYSEIAQVHGITKRTVERNMATAIEACRANLAELEKDKS